MSPGPICKYYHNSGFAAFAKANASAIRDSEARGLIKPGEAHDLYDKMAQIETEAYQRMCKEVTAVLEEKGLVNESIWTIWQRP